MEDGYCIKWEKHHNAIVSVFDNLYKHNILVDCTLAAENKFIKAHRIVLMACSPYFEDLLSQHSECYPIIWLNMKFIELEALVNFCYRGEVQLSQAELPGFLNAARLLHIKGLCKSSESYHKRRQLEEGGMARKKCKVDDGLVKDGRDGVDSGGDYTGQEDDDSYRNIVHNGDPMIHIQADDKSDRSDLDTDDESSGGEEQDSIALSDLMITGGVGESQLLYRWRCQRCAKAFSTRATYQEHKRGCTVDPGVDHPWRCHKCPNTYKNKKDLVRHLLYCGNKTERHICERCGSTYKYERGLKRHKIYCGTDVKPMVCNACGKTYKYKRGLRRHQKQQCGLIESFMENRAARMRGEDVVDLTSKSPVKIISTPKPVSNPSNKSLEGEDEATETTQSTLKDGYAPAVCQTCGKIYKYKKSYLNHIVNCVATEEPQADEEEPDVGKALTEIDKEPSAKDTSLDDDNIDAKQSEDEPSMDDKTMEKEIDELVAFKKELEQDEEKGDASTKPDPLLEDDESQNNNEEELKSDDVKEAEETT